MSTSSFKRSRSRQISRACFEPLEDRRLLSFTPAVNYSGAARAIATADLNGDGKLDLATTIGNVTGKVSVRLGNGAGGFGAAQEYAVPDYSSLIFIADFNNDTRPDLLASDPYNGSSTLIGNGDGTFQPAVRLTQSGLTSKGVVALGRSNHGTTEVVVNWTGADWQTYVQVYAGSLQGGFTTGQDAYYWGNGGMAPVDLDNDGQLDVATGDGVVFLGGINQSLYLDWRQTASLTGGAVATGDFTGDGNADVIVAGSSVAVFRGRGDGRLDAPIHHSANGTRHAAVTTADFNVDGKLDAIVTDVDLGTVSLMLGNGDGTLRYAGAFATGTSPTGVVVGDFNRDGRPDVAVANAGPSRCVSVLLNEAPGLSPITGTNGDDVYYVVRAGTLLKVYENIAPVGPPTYSSELAALGAGLTINTLGGNDTLYVDSGGEPTLGLSRLVHNAGTGDNSLVLQSGSARIDSMVETGGTLDSTIETGAQLTTNQLNQNGLTLADTSRVTLLPGGATSRITSLTVGAGAILDVTDNALVIDYAGTSPAATVRAHILSGRGGAGLGETWNGAGITSSTAAQVNATAPDSRSVGYAENALMPLGSVSTFRGQVVDATSILIVYTRTADANLDGIVANDDVTVVGANYAPGASKPIGSAWALGDFEYNGSVDNDDVTLLGVFYNPAANPAPAPPPATLSPEIVSTALGSEASARALSRAAQARRELIAGRPGVELVAAPTPNSPLGEAKGLLWKYEGASAIDDHDVIELLAESIATGGDVANEDLTTSRRASAGRSNAAEIMWSEWP